MCLTPQPPQRQARAMQLSASLSTISSAAPQLGRVLLTWPRPAAASPGPAPSFAPAAAAPQSRPRRCRRAPRRRCRSGRGRRLIGAAAPGPPMRRRSCGSNIAQLNSLGVTYTACASVQVCLQCSEQAPPLRLGGQMLHLMTMPRCLLVAAGRALVVCRCPLLPLPMRPVSC